MKKKLFLPLLLALLLGVGICCAAEALPPYAYSGEDAIEGAVANYTADEFGKQFLTEEGSVTIPTPVILKTEAPDDSHATVYGNFWVFNYVRSDDVLRMISGGEFPGVIQLEKQDGAWRVTGAEYAGDGEDYGKDITRFCNGDKALEERYFEAGDGGSDLHLEVRRRFISDYIKANGLNVAAWQDPFWPPTPLAESVQEPIRGGIENGSYVVKVPVTGVPGRWEAFAPEGENAAVRLASADLSDGCFTARFDPIADGAGTVWLKHYTGIACDQAHSFDLLVENGQVKENTAGSYTASPLDEELDPWLKGQWLEDETQFPRMEITRDPYQGWNVEIVSPMTHGAYVFRANAAYDCDKNCLVYRDGTFWSLSAETGEADQVLADNTQGRFALLEDEAAGTEADAAHPLKLKWESGQDIAPETTFIHD